MTNVGNVAHFSGLAFGALLGLCYFRKTVLAIVGAIAMVVIAIVPMFWSPRSSTWVYVQAVRALDHHDTKKAMTLFNRSLQMGYNPAEVLYYLAEIYAYETNVAEYRKAFARLKQVDNEAAKEVADRYGDPDDAEWLAIEANEAYIRRDFAKAAELGKKALEKGMDPRVGWRALAQTYLMQGKEQEYDEAIAHLYEIDPKLGEKARKELGPFKKQAAPSK